MLKRSDISLICLWFSLLLSGHHGLAQTAAAFPDLVPTDWPWWRGYQRDASATGAQAPIHWSATSNVAWKISVPGQGHSSPIIVGSRVFLTTADEQAQTQSLLCLDAQSGELLWNKVVSKRGFMPKHANNSHASATPASDGRRIFTVFLNHDRLLVNAFDLEGELLWTNSLAPFGLAPAHEGYGSSPVLFGNHIIVNADNRLKGKLVAIERATGRIAWSVDRRSLGSFASPSINQSSGRWQLIISGTGWVDAYAPSNGKQLWSCRGTAEATANTVAVSDRFALASGGAPEREMLCVRTDGQGDVTASHAVWRTSKGITYVPSPLHFQNRFYVLTDNGILQCLEDSTGKEIWSQRLGGSFKASLIRQGNHLYSTSEDGRTYVVQVGDEYKLLATNKLPEGSFATPAISRDSIYLRTQQSLYRLHTSAAR